MLHSVHRAYASNCPFHSTWWKGANIKHDCDGYSQIVSFVHGYLANPMFCYNYTPLSDEWLLEFVKQISFSDSTTTIIYESSICHLVLVY